MSRAIYTRPELLELPGKRPGEKTFYIRDNRGTMMKVPPLLVRHTMELNHSYLRRGLAARPWYFSLFSRLRNKLTRGL